MLAATNSPLRAGIDEYSKFSPIASEKIIAVSASPLTANDCSSPRINPTTTTTNRTTVVKPTSVSAVRSGRRNKFRMAYSQGSSRHRANKIESQIEA